MPSLFPVKYHSLRLQGNRLPPARQACFPISRPTRQSTPDDRTHRQDIRLKIEIAIAIGIGIETIPAFPGTGMIKNGLQKSPRSAPAPDPDEFHVRQARCILRNPASLDLELLQSRRIATFYECIKILDFLRSRQFSTQFLK